VKPAQFSYERPDSVATAIELLVDADGRAKVLAGGQSLIPLLAYRLVRPTVLVDIGRIPGLDHITVDERSVRIGSVATHRSVELDPTLSTLVPLLAEGLAHLGHATIRNAGTVGGSIAHADPAAEWGAMALVLDATVLVAGPGGTRTVPVDRFFVDWMQPDLAVGEIITAVELTLPPTGCGWGFREMARRHGDFALAGAAAVVSVVDGKLAHVRIGLLGAGLTPLRASSVEASLVGRFVDDVALEAACAEVASDISPLDDQHASADDKRHLTRILTRRALGQAIERAVGAG
jgi:carbon-monoxide dehydrogenase medium subunit